MRPVTTRLFVLAFALLPLTAWSAEKNASQPLGHFLPGDVSYLPNPQASEAFEPIFDSTYFPILTDWGPEQTLSDSTMHLFDPRMAVGDSVVHIFAFMMTDYRFHFRSTNNGCQWSLFDIYTDTLSSSLAGTVNTFAEGPHLYTTWCRRRGNENDVAYFRASTDYGATWPVTKEIVQRPLEWMPVMHSNVSGRRDTAFVAFFEDSLACWRSFDGGVHWADPGYIAEFDESYPPSIAYGAGTVYIVYTNLTDHQIDIYFTRSTDHGATFAPPQFLGIPDGLHGQWPELAADFFGNVAVAWMDYHGSTHSWTGAAICRVSHDFGQTWGELVRLDTRDYLADPGMGVVIDGDFVAVAWTEAGGWNGELRYRESWNGGASWLPEQILDQGWVSAPRLLKRGLIMHVTWTENTRVSEPDNDRQFLKYMRNDELSGAREDAMPPPMESGLFSYPNPFNAATVITTEGMENCEIAIFDLTGRRVATLQAKGGQAVWDARGLSSGVYFARAVGENWQSNIIKLIYIK